ncbi:MAG TPA: hypothetical protein VGV14_04095 [Rhodanobacter sp.]|nr:hypothetical protein [Rhodanobacter sp.]
MDSEFGLREEAMAFHREGKRALFSPISGGLRVTLVAASVLIVLLAVTLALPVAVHCSQSESVSTEKKIRLVFFLWHASPSSNGEVTCQ